MTPSDSVEIPTWALQTAKIIALYVVIPLIIGVVTLAWRLGWSEWTDREDRLDRIEKKIGKLENALNGGPLGEGIESEVHEIKRMLKERQ